MNNNKSRRKAKKYGGRDYEQKNPNKLSGAIEIFEEETRIIAERLRIQEEEYFEEKKENFISFFKYTYMISQQKIEECKMSKTDICELSDGFDSNVINKINEEFPKSNANNKQRRKKLRNVLQSLLKLLHDYLDMYKTNGDLTKAAYLHIMNQLYPRKIKSSSSSSTRKTRKIQFNV